MYYIVLQRIETEIFKTKLYYSLFVMTTDHGQGTRNKCHIFRDTFFGLRSRCISLVVTTDIYYDIALKS